MHDCNELDAAQELPEVMEKLDHIRDSAKEATQEDRRTLELTIDSLKKLPRTAR